MAEDGDAYEHLVAHLVDDEPEQRDTNEWTRVFTRDAPNGHMVAIHPLGPDLMFDKSVRDSLSSLGATGGCILFSPLQFKKQDLDRDLSECRIPMPELLELGRIATKAKIRFAEAESHPMQRAHSTYETARKRPCLLTPTPLD